MIDAPFLISPSLLACKDWLNFKNILNQLETMELDSLHIDVMDAHFVPNLAFGPDLVRSIQKHTQHNLDVHLMVRCLEPMLEKYVALKPRTVFFHPEVVATDQVFMYIDQIKKSGVQAGLALHPDISVLDIEPYLECISSCLVMTVYPGFSGQAFIPNHLEKVRQLKDRGFKGTCWVDGGVSPSIFEQLKQCGIDGAVMGSSFFSN